MFEHRSKLLLLHPHLFALRMLRHVAIALALLGLSLEDAFLNAAMLLGGMGPVNAPTTLGGKLFAGCYVLYAGLVFLISVAVFLSPVVHRAFHQFHWDGKD